MHDKDRMIIPFYALICIYRRLVVVSLLQLYIEKLTGACILAESPVKPGMDVWEKVTFPA
jgi:hypothetical protein